MRYQENGFARIILGIYLYIICLFSFIVIKDGIEAYKLIEI